MKRTIPQKVRSVPACADDSSAAIADSMKNSTQDASRRSCGSAAMLGVALSVGACGLLVPQKSNATIAQEPTATEPLKAEPTNQPVSTTPLTALVPTADVATIVPDTHVVQEGETLWKLAQQYGLDVAALADANRLQPSSVLRVGQVIRIPSRAENAAAAMQNSELKNTLSQEASEVTTIAPTQAETYGATGAGASSKLKQDSAIAKLKEQRDRLKSSLAELKSEESSRQVASIGVPGTPTEAMPQSLVDYQVSRGETLSTIAKAHGISYRELAALNNLVNPDLLKADQVLKVPQSQAVSPSLRSASTSISAPVVIAKATPALSAQAEARPTAAVVVPVQPVATEAKIDVDAGLPAASRTGSQNSTVSADAQPSGQYVDGLVGEIAKLREKYQSSSSQGQATPTKIPQRAEAPVPASLALNAPKPAAVNPEFRSGNRLASLPSEVQSLSEQRAKQVSKVPALPVADLPKPQLIARASLGSEAYAPVVKAAVRQMVSPSLPPIGTPENYLPGAGNKVNGYIWPAEGVFTSGYGPRWGRMHRGIDIAAPVGTPVVASAAGVISFAGWNDGGYGYLVEVTHPDGSMTRYAHNSRILVSVGQQVAQGQQIAAMGSTGFSTGPHSHFEIHLPGRGTVNPIAYLVGSPRS